MDGVDILDQETATYKLYCKLPSGSYYLKLFFDVMDIFVVNSHAIYKLLYPKGMELLDFKIVLAKSLIGTSHRRSRNTLVSHVSLQKVLPTSVPVHFPVLQTTRGYTAMLEGLKTKHAFNVIHVELFCA